MNPNSNLRTSFLLALAAAAAACSGGSGDTASAFSGSFDVVSTEPLNSGRLYLNDPIRFDFSTPVDVRSASLDSVSFSVLDLNGSPVAEQPTGFFEIGTRPGDTAPGRRLLFVPTLPTNDNYDNGGFRPGRTYLVRLVGGDRRNNAVLLAANGKSLTNPQTFRFTTADGTTPTELFRNVKAGGPRKTNFAITPTPEANLVSLNKFGAPPVEVRLSFDQALNPNSGNVPTALDTDPRVRSSVNRGRIFLEYDDYATGNPVSTWIPADVELETNGLNGSTVVLRPVGVLPNNATVRVIVESTTEDISGESNVANAAYQRIFATFRTQASYEPQFDSLVEQFANSSQIDFDAAFLEPLAEVGTGFIRSSFDYEGGSTELMFEPTTASVILNTDFTQVQPSNGPAFNVSGGQFNFKSVRIPENVIVKGQGTRPMVWLVRDEFRVDGLLSVRGGDGDRVNTLNSANFPTAGGVGVCAGGNGGKGSPSSTQRSPQGEAGFGANQAPAKGGQPGRISCGSPCNLGSGGGGGSLATQGDPFYKELRGTGSLFQQQEGLGGNGCTGNAGATTRTLAGGAAGARVFSDARTDNDFWGVGINRQRQIRIRGELAAPVGGAGGGGGGDLAPDCVINTPNFVNDNKGGGGGGGGGVLIVKALGPIIIGPRGRIEADGGHGGGGEQAGSCNQGGGGGAGSGGMVILMSATRIEFNARGTGANYRYASPENEYTFAISADGGICRTGQFLTPDVQSKYPVSGQGTVLPAAQYDIRPLGGLGGMGVVQLMAPPGDPSGPNVDGTNTVLDDNIVIRRAGVISTGTQKQQLLAWRGFPNSLGTLVDDAGTPTNIGANEGDIRPAPVLLPVPYNSVTRARSKWIDLGASKRRSLIAPDGFPRGVTDPTGSLTGPRYEYAAIINDPTKPLKNGYSQWQVQGGSALVSYPALFAAPGVTVLGVQSNASFRGQPAYRIELTQAQLGSDADRYVGYEAELISSAGSVRGSYRILSHTDRVLLVSQDMPLDATATTLQVRAKFFKVKTDGSEGLGSTYVGTGGATVPISNVRIGFAFHQNPDQAATGAIRFPAGDGFAYNLTDVAVQEQIRQLGAAFVQWDVQFNSTYKAEAGDVNPRPFGPNSPRPELQFLRLPFRF
ncbi:MAG: hypothetical protein RLZZ562_811 [Planctomycetota bacterium]|jgi:hypothetical protein